MSSRGAESGCPECGEPIGARATYCMHCGADLPDRAPTPEDADDGDDSFFSRVRSWASDESGGEVTIERERERASSESSETASTRERENADRVPRRNEGTTERAGGAESDAQEGLVDGAFASSLKAAGATLGVAGLVLLYATSISVPGTVAALVAWAVVSAAILARDPALDAVPRLVAGFVLFVLFVPTAFSFGTGLSPMGLLSAGIVLLVPGLFVAWSLRHK
jgi:hypothetical protein